jgi:hypothetical protein
MDADALVRNELLHCREWIGSESEGYAVFASQMDDARWISRWQGKLNYPDC